MLGIVKRLEGGGDSGDWGFGGLSPGVWADGVGWVIGEGEGLHGE